MKNARPCSWANEVRRLPRACCAWGRLDSLRVAVSHYLCLRIEFVHSYAAYRRFAQLAGLNGRVWRLPCNAVPCLPPQRPQAHTNEATRSRLELLWEVARLRPKELERLWEHHPLQMVCSSPKTAQLNVNRLPE